MPQPKAKPAPKPPPAPRASSDERDDNPNDPGIDGVVLDPVTGEPIGEGTPRPPKNGARSSDDARRLTSDEKRLAESLEEMYGMVAMFLGGIGAARQDEGIILSAQQIMVNAETVSQAWIDLARKNPRVRSTLKKMTEASASGIVIAMHFSMAAPFLQSRGIIPGGPVPA